MFNKKKQQAIQLSLKGCALIAAIETGLLPEIAQDGEVGYDDELFSRFWDMYNELAEMREEPFRKKRKNHAKNRT